MKSSSKVCCTAKISLICLPATRSECLHLTNDPSTCWLFVEDVTTTWGGAAQTCIGLRGHLAIELDNTIRGVILAELQANRAFARKYWMGMRNSSASGWRWINGRQILPLPPPSGCMCRSLMLTYCAASCDYMFVSPDTFYRVSCAWISLETERAGPQRNMCDLRGRNHQHLDNGV